MLARATIMTFATLALLAGVTGAQDAVRQVEEAIAEVDRLREAGKLGEARQRVQQTLSVSKKDVPPALMSRLVLAQDAVVVAAAAAYARGEECGFIPAEERERNPAFAGRSPTQLGIGMFASLFGRLERVESPDVRSVYMSDPAFAPLRERPLARCIFASTWRRPHREVWPGVRVETGDPAFDATFDLVAHLGVERPGEDGPAREWFAAEERVRRRPGDEWAFRWRSALLAPQDKGGFPFRTSLLKQPEFVSAALAQLRERAGHAPWGFDALCLVNLTIAAGEHERALALLGRLQRQGGFLYDQAVDKALSFAQSVEPRNAALQSLIDALVAHGAGVAPAPTPPRDDFGPLRGGIEELERLRAAGKYADMRARFKANKQLVPRGVPLPGDLQGDLFATEVAAATAAAMAYARGEDGAWYTAEELRKPPLKGKSRRALAVSILEPLLLQLNRGVPAAELRHRLLTDPRLDALMQTPMMRAQSWSWGRPPAEVWPDLRVDTGDDAFDALFRSVAMLSPRPGILLGPVHEFVRGPGARAGDVADVWVFRWKCVFLAPYGEGGWPTRISLLEDPDAVRETLRNLESRSGADPAGFDALLRVNLHIAAGAHERARALVATLEQDGGILYDLAVTKGLTMAYNVRGDEAAPAPLAALIDDLTQRLCGLPPEPRRAR